MTVADAISLKAASDFLAEHGDPILDIDGVSAIGLAQRDGSDEDHPLKFVVMIDLEYEDDDGAVEIRRVTEQIRAKYTNMRVQQYPIVVEAGYLEAADNTVVRTNAARLSRHILHAGIALGVCLTAAVIVALST